MEASEDFLGASHEHALDSGGWVPGWKITTVLRIDIDVA